MRRLFAYKVFIIFTIPIQQKKRNTKVDIKKIIIGLADMSNNTSCFIIALKTPQYRDWRTVNQLLESRVLKGQTKLAQSVMPIICIITLTVK